jgi:hypothetical protein
MYSYQKEERVQPRDFLTKWCYFYPITILIVCSSANSYVDAVILSKFSKCYTILLLVFFRTSHSYRTRIVRRQRNQNCYTRPSSIVLKLVLFSLDASTRMNCRRACLHPGPVSCDSILPPCWPVMERLTLRRRRGTWVIVKDPARTAQ